MQQLVYEKNNQPLKIGDTVTTFRGETGVLKGIGNPRHAGSAGRVYVELTGNNGSQEFFPSVVGAKWADL